MSAQAGTTQQDLAGLNQSNKSMKFMDDQKVRQLNILLQNCKKGFW